VGVNPCVGAGKCAANLILEIFKNAKRGQFIFSLYYYFQIYNYFSNNKNFLITPPTCRGRCPILFGQRRYTIKKILPLHLFPAKQKKCIGNGKSARTGKA